MLEPLEKTELFQLFAGNFSQDYYLFTDVDWDKPFIPQVVETYRKDCSPQQLEQAIKELNTLLALEYSEEQLKDEIFPELVIEMSMTKLGLTHQKFLIEVFNALKRHDNEGTHTQDRHLGKSERWLRDRIQKENLDEASSFHDYSAANLAQARFVKENKKEIEAWLKSKRKGTFVGEVKLNRNIGVYVPKRGKARQVKKAKVVLGKKNSELGYRAVTSFPIP